MVDSHTSPYGPQTSFGSAESRSVGENPGASNGKKNHPERGTFLIDTGVARSIAGRTEDMPIGPIVRSAMNIDSLVVHIDTRSWLERSVSGRSVSSRSNLRVQPSAARSTSSETGRFSASTSRPHMRQHGFLGAYDGGAGAHHERREPHGMLAAGEGAQGPKVELRNRTKTSWPSFSSSGTRFPASETKTTTAPFALIHCEFDQPFASSPLSVTDARKVVPV